MRKYAVIYLKKFSYLLHKRGYFDILKSKFLSYSTLCTKDNISIIMYFEDILGLEYSNIA